MRSLYEIVEELKEADFIDEDGVVDTEMLDSLTLEFDEKIENMALYIKNLESEKEALGAEEKSFYERKKAKEKRANALREYLTNALTVLEKKKFESIRVSLALRESKSVEFSDEAKFVKWAIKHKQEDFIQKQAPKVAKMIIKEALKQGEELPYVYMKTKQNLQIK